MSVFKGPWKCDRCKDTRVIWNGKKIIRCPDCTSLGHRWYNMGMTLNTSFTMLPSYAGPCPRCGEPVPSRENQGQYPGALSRVDNKTYICSQCGTDEAMYQWSTGGKLPPLDRPARLNEEA